MRHTRFLGPAFSVLWLLASGCGSSTAGGTGGASGTGTGGVSGTGTGGSSGSTGGASGTGGAGSGFTSVMPCTTQAMYVTTGTTVNFGPTAAYDPRCLRVSAGATVTFAGDFSAHPLSPSTMRGTIAGNPITHVGALTSSSFTFPTPGYYAYYCDLHGPSDSGAGMVGVVWVQ